MTPTQLQTTARDGSLEDLAKILKGWGDIVAPVGYWVDGLGDKTPAQVAVWSDIISEGIEMCPDTAMKEQKRALLFAFESGSGIFDQSRSAREREIQETKAAITKLPPANDLFSLSAGVSSGRLTAKAGKAPALK